jgi:hypothetical protein
MLRDERIAGRRLPVAATARETRAKERANAYHFRRSVHALKRRQALVAASETRAMRAARRKLASDPEAALSHAGALHTTAAVFPQLQLELPPGITARVDSFLTYADGDPTKVCAGFPGTRRRECIVGLVRSAAKAVDAQLGDPGQPTLRMVFYCGTRPMFYIEDNGQNYLGGIYGLTREASKQVHRALRALRVESFPSTDGGIHRFIPRRHAVDRLIPPPYADPLDPDIIGSFARFVLGPCEHVVVELQVRDLTPEESLDRSERTLASHLRFSSWHWLNLRSGELVNVPSPARDMEPTAAAGGASRSMRGKVRSRSRRGWR